MSFVGAIFARAVSTRPLEERIVASANAIRAHNTRSSIIAGSIRDEYKLKLSFVNDSVCHYISLVRLRSARLRANSVKIFYVVEFCDIPGSPLNSRLGLSRTFSSNVFSLTVESVKGCSVLQSYICHRRLVCHSIRYECDYFSVTFVITFAYNLSAYRKLV